LVLSRDIGDIDGISFSLFELGNMALIRGDFKQAKANYQESIPLARSIKNLLSLSWMHVNMSYSALKMGEFELGKVLLEKTSGLLRELGDWPNLAFVLNRLGRLACLQSEYDQAREYYLQSLVVISNNYKDKVAIWSITGLAELYALRGNPRKAARLLACAWNLPDSRVYIYHMLFSDMPHELKQIEETIRSNLDDPTFKAEQELGRQMSLADAIQYAQEGI
jgi:tetratricopeptide (TPR) repeat protein